MRGWEEIETAPNEGTFLAFGYYFYPGDTHPTTYRSLAWRANNGLFEDEEGIHPPGHFSHWAPIPNDPVIPARSPSDSKSWRFANE